MLFLLE